MKSPSIYQYIASIYMVHGSIYMVDCSIYHVFLYIPCSLLYIPCSLIYIHGSLLYIPCFPRKKRICKIMYNSGFELTISCRPQGRANHCTTSVDTGMCLCTVLVCLILHCGEYVTWRLVSDIRRGARRATRSGHDVAGPGLHLDRSDARLRRAACR